MPKSGENVSATFQPLPAHESLLNLPSRFRDRALGPFYDPPGNLMMDIRCKSMFFPSSFLQ
jgi:hypothetical protein